jgi:transcriptional regulator with XRE-family HTH domain
MTNSSNTPPRIEWRAHGHRLRVIRAALGLTEREAAAAHGVTLRTYRRWEAGARPRHVGVAFAERYDVSLDWLVLGKGERLGRHLTRGRVAILAR